MILEKMCISIKVTERDLTISLMELSNWFGASRECMGRDYVEILAQSCPTSPTHLKYYNPEPYDNKHALRVYHFWNSSWQYQSNGIVL